MTPEDERSPLLDKEQRILELALERAGQSSLFKKLDPQQKEKFIQSTMAVVNKTLEGSDLRTIRNVWRDALEQAGAEELMLGMKEELVKDFSTSWAGIAPAIRTSARDVLHVLSDPKAFQSIADIRKITARAKDLGMFGIQEGRVLHTREVQPPTTIRTSLHKGE